MTEQRMNRREFLIFGLASTGGLAWLLAQPDIQGLMNGGSFQSSVAKAASNKRVSLRSATGNQGQVNYQPELYLARAKEMYAIVQKTYAIPGKAMFYDYPNPKLNTIYGLRLWSYTAALAALAALATASGEGIDRSEYQRILDGIETYNDSSSPLVYQCYMVEKGSAARFYDDNDWVGLAFMDAHTITNDKKYLLKAIDIFRWLTTGWDEAMGGGFYWLEDDHSTKNTCSNGPAAVLALKLYQATGQAGYLNWAQATIKWLYRLKDPTTGVYWDSINRNGIIDRHFWTYNVGSVIHANALLYQITAAQEYLDEARRLASASLRQFAVDRGNGEPIFPNTPWFNTVMLRGYVALFEIDPDQDTRYLDMYIKNLDYAWENARQKDGTICPDWSGMQPSLGFRRWLLDQVPVIESYATLSRMSAGD